VRFRALWTERDSFKNVVIFSHAIPKALGEKYDESCILL
jgi:hypothetical protein